VLIVEIELKNNYSEKRGEKKITWYSIPRRPLLSAVTYLHGSKLSI
jgi:hypothetical protein